MSAQQQMRQKLDGLMGTGRDGTRNPMHYSDPKVCRCFLLGLCPHEALSGTKMALGECPKIHDYALKADFENSSKTSQHTFYDLTVLAYLQKVIRSCEIMDQAKKGRLNLCQAQTGGAAAAQKEAELKRYGDIIDTKIAAVEELGSMGMAEASLALIRDIERLKRKRTLIERYLFYKSSEPAKEQKMMICEECQLCIGLDNNQQRVANHSSGRLHHAMLAMRRKITELSARLEGVKFPGDWARQEVQQQMRTRSNPALVSPRARSRSPYSRSSSRSRSRSRYRFQPRSRRSYSRSRSSSGSSYSRSRSRTLSNRRSTSRQRTRSRSRTESRSSTRSRSSCSSITRSRSSSKDILRAGPGSTSQRDGTYRKRTKTCSVTRTTSRSPQGISGQQCLRIKDDGKSCSQSASTPDQWKSVLDGNQKSAGPNEERHAQAENTARHMASSNATMSLRSSTARIPYRGRPLPESELTGLPGENWRKTCPGVSLTKNTRSRSKRSRSKRSPGRKHSRSRCRKKEKRTRTKTDLKDREDMSEDENPRGSTARAEQCGGQADLGPTPDSKRGTTDFETRDKAGSGDFSSPSPAPKSKWRKVMKRKYLSRGRRLESYEESSKSTSCSEESRRGAIDSEPRKRKTTRREGRHSTSSSESPLRRKSSKKKRARKTVNKKKKLSSNSKKTKAKTVKKLRKKRSVSPSPSESSSLDTDMDSSEEQRSKKKRRYKSKRKVARRTSKKKPKESERIKSRKGSRQKKRRRL